MISKPERPGISRESTGTPPGFRSRPRPRVLFENSWLHGDSLLPLMRHILAESFAASLRSVGGIWEHFRARGNLEHLWELDSSSRTEALHTVLVGVSVNLPGVVIVDLLNHLVIRPLPMIHTLSQRGSCGAGISIEGPLRRVAPPCPGVPQECTAL